MFSWAAPTPCLERSMRCQAYEDRFQHSPIHALCPRCAFRAFGRRHMWYPRATKRAPTFTRNAADNPVVPMPAGAPRRARAQRANRLRSALFVLLLGTRQMWACSRLPRHLLPRHAPRATAAVLDIGALLPIARVAWSRPALWGLTTFLLSSCALGYVGRFIPHRRAYAPSMEVL